MKCNLIKEREREMFYLTTHSTHFIYGYMESDIWLRTILIVRKETCCRHIGYSHRLTARVLLYAPSQTGYHIPQPLLHQSWSTGSMGPPNEGSIRRPIAPWVNALTTELHLAPSTLMKCNSIKRAVDELPLTAFEKLPKWSNENYKELKMILTFHSKVQTTQAWYELTV